MACTQTPGNGALTRSLQDLAALSTLPGLGVGGIMRGGSCGAQQELLRHAAPAGVAWQMGARPYFTTPTTDVKQYRERKLVG